MADELEVVTAERDMLLLQVDQLTHDNRLLRNSNARHLIDLAAMREEIQEHHDLHHKREWINVSNLTVRRVNR